LSPAEDGFAWISGCLGTWSKFFAGLASYRCDLGLSENRVYILYNVYIYIYPLKYGHFMMIMRIKPWIFRYPLAGNTLELTGIPWPSNHNQSCKPFRRSQVLPFFFMWRRLNLFGSEFHSMINPQFWEPYIPFFLVPNMCFNPLRYYVHPMVSRSGRVS
jgi:hypothetical protein